MDGTDEDDFIPEEVIELDGNEIDEDLEVSENDPNISIGGEDDGMEENPLEDESIYSFEEHEQSVFCCDVSHDDKLAITGGQDDQAILWDTNSKIVKFKTTGHKDSVVAVKFNKNSSMVATGDMSGLIFVWDLDGNQLYDFEVDDLNWILWHPVMENVLLAGTEATWMWKLSKSNPQCKTFQSFGCNNVVAKFFNDGKRVAMGYEDGSYRIWDLKETKVIATFTDHQAHNSVTLDINSDDTLMATGCSDMTVKILNVNNQKVLATFKLETMEDDGIESLVFGANDCLVVGTLNGFIQVWHVPSQVKRNEIKFPMGVSKLMVDKHNTNIVYAGCLDAIFRVFDLRTCEILQEKTGHREQILDFVISSDSKYALTCSDDATCKIFELN